MHVIICIFLKDLLSTVSGHSKVTLPQVLVVSDSPNMVSIKSKKYIIWYLREHDEKWISDKVH